ncbi:MAG: hypothetical protein E6K66_09470 [Nitrospirae bacterium]|nr:MAG: hypothetical protein E6K66_09470 [Nitrospirota bacterium]
MSNQQTATAILALEECIEQYITECRGRVDGFVERHFSLQETIALQKQSLVSDLLCHPINALWSIPSLFLKKIKSRIGILFSLSTESIVLASLGGHIHCWALCHSDEPSRRTVERSLS